MEKYCQNPLCENEAIKVVPVSVDKPSDQTLRRCQIARKLERLAIQAEDLTVTVPTLPVAQWLDGTFQDAKVEVSFEKCDLARLLQFIADYGVSEQS